MLVNFYSGVLIFHGQSLEDKYSFPTDKYQLRFFQFHVKFSQSSTIEI